MPYSRMRNRPTVGFGPYVLLCSPSTTERVMVETRPVRSAYRFSALVRSDDALPGKLAELNMFRAGSVLWIPKERRGNNCVPRLSVYSFCCEKVPPIFTRWLPCNQEVLPLNCLMGLLRREGPLLL